MQRGEFIDFSEFLTDNARSSLQQAEAIARSLGSVYIGTEHILLGVLSQGNSVGAKLLDKVGVTLERAQLALNLTPKALVINTGARGLSETAKLTLRMSWDVAQEFNQDYCGTEHILFSIMTQKNARATVLLRDMNVDIDALTSELEGYLQRQQSEFESELKADANARRTGVKRGGVVDSFGVDLTSQAEDSELDPVIGREDIIKRVTTVLGRRTKNNPVLIGEPGVGKTAVVEGLAQAIASEDAPEHALEMRIVSLDLAGMIAGTKYRGEFEERLKRLVEEASRDRNLVLFIDELHLLVGAGAAEGALDAANILKPALARGNMRVIGATTLDEYRKHIEKDAALERRFQPVIVPEPDIKEATAIVRGLKHHYEKYHGVAISDDVAADAVKLADRFISERFMPDKAIDVLDETAAHVKAERGKANASLRRIQREVKLVSGKMEEAVEVEDYERAALYKTRLSRLEQRARELKETHQSKQKLVMNTNDIATTIARSTGIPVTQLLRQEAQFLKNLDDHLRKAVIGQEAATSAVARAIRRNRLGIASSNRPIGSFIFMGPSGVGKTEMARVLAREVFGRKDALIKIDMSEFSERHTSSRLLGAPAGYVGYDDGGELTEKVRRNPYSVILFDEIEKAHPDVLNMLLQILEDGYVSDAKGRRVNFAHSIIILTSNVGAEKLQREADFGFNVHGRKEEDKLDELHQKHERDALEELRKTLRPELLNRFDKVVVFRALTRKDALAIAHLQISELNERLQHQHLKLQVQNSAYTFLLDKGYEAMQGVRPLRRAIQEHIEDRLADEFLSGAINRGDVVRVSARKGVLAFNAKQE
ncbi:ATP-dependent Clp protease ATP-binding subunit [Candidatus Saccharibacteria bacterium]|nr:ATP-dependent Clp protease ATP-binding subunit [Candidatus Saccharibacteria bacterium]